MTSLWTLANKSGVECRTEERTRKDIRTFRFRVTGETFVDTGPKAPLAAETEAEENKAAPYRLPLILCTLTSNVPWLIALKKSKNKIFCSIVGSCSEPGLGLLSWWS